MPRVLAASACLLALLAWPAAARAAAPPVRDTGAEIVIGDGAHRVVVTKAPWRLSVRTAQGTVVATEAPSVPLGVMPNPDRALYRDRVGSIDVAYPGLEEVSYLPLSFLRDGAWEHVTRLDTVGAKGDAVLLQVETSDGRGAAVSVALEEDGAVVRLGFDPAGEGVDAVSEAFTAPPHERFLGGGQRFGALDQRGRSVPLWISHGVGSDRYGSTNEAAVPFLLSTGGWGLGAESDARGEMNIGLAGERPDALNVVLEDDRLDVLLFAGSPQRVLAEYTERTGRPDPVAPEWAFRPAYWRDEDTSQRQIEEYVARFEREGIPVGAVWIDNPWEHRRGDLAPHPNRFPDFDGMVGALRDRGIRVAAWVSPFASDDSRVGQVAARDGLFVEGLPADGNDQTYVPPRGLDPHLDLTDERAAGALADAAAALLRRGVDGFKADRGEEDLGDGSQWANGLPNRLNHNPYVRRYHAALREGCRRARKAADCFVIARGGWRGGQRHAALWAADNLSAPGTLGLEQALNSLLSLSVSGYPVSGSDIGGYVGTREAGGEGFPTRALFLRWTQLGALSPVMQTLHFPWDFGDDPETVRIFRRFANLHTRLVPTLKRLSDEAAATGTPIVRPLPYAYPDDPAAVQVDDQYLLGPDLLVAPLTEGAVDGPEVRQVYLPAGRWRDAWTGQVLEGPQSLQRTSPLDELPLYLREGGAVPASLFAGLDEPVRAPFAADRPPGGKARAGRSRFSAKLVVRRARVRRGRLDVLARISGRASGRVQVRFRAAGRTRRWSVPVNAVRRRVRFTRRLSRAQSRRGTGILTLRYRGDADTSPRTRTVRLRGVSRGRP